MTGLVHRPRAGRLGVLAVVLLALLILVLAHSLMMEAAHDGQEGCVSCVVVLMTGLAVMGVLRGTSRLAAPVIVWGGRSRRVVPVASEPRAPAGGFTVLRL